MIAGRIQVLYLIFERVYFGEKRASSESAFSCPELTYGVRFHGVPSSHAFLGAKVQIYDLFGCCFSKHY
jgi:hypothetical protein